MYVRESHCRYVVYLYPTTVASARLLTMSMRGGALEWKPENDSKGWSPEYIPSPQLILQ